MKMKTIEVNGDQATFFDAVMWACLEEDGEKKLRDDIEQGYDDYIKENLRTICASVRIKMAVAMTRFVAGQGELAKVELYDCEYDLLKAGCVPVIDIAPEGVRDMLGIESEP